MVLKKIIFQNRYVELETGTHIFCHLRDHYHHHHTTDLVNSHYARVLAWGAAAVGRRQRWRALLQVPGQFRLKYCAVQNESKWKYEHSICFCSPWSIAPLSCRRYGKCVDGVCVPGRLVDHSQNSLHNMFHRNSRLILINRSQTNFKSTSQFVCAFLRNMFTRRSCSCQCDGPHCLMRGKLYSFTLKYFLRIV